MTVLRRSRTEIVCFNPTRGMNVRLRSFRRLCCPVYVNLLRRADPPLRSNGWRWKAMVCGAENENTIPMAHTKLSSFELFTQYGRVSQQTCRLRQ